MSKRRGGWSKASMSVSLARTSPCRENGTAKFSPMSVRSEEHTSELQSLMRISYAVFCLKKKTLSPSTETNTTYNTHTLQKSIQYSELSIPNNYKLHTINH